MSATRGAETPIALDPDGVPIVVDGVLAEDSAAADASESCVICVSRPRAVRFLPCSHASLCQLCTIQEMQRSGQCPVARCSVVQLVAVPVASTDPLSVRRMQTHQDAPEPEGSTFASFAAFLQVMLDSADTEVAQAARAALASQAGAIRGQVGIASSADTVVGQAARVALASQAGANRGQRGFAPQGMRRTTTHVTIPEGTTELSVGAFSGRRSLVNVTFPASLRHIGRHAFGRDGPFDGCISLALTCLPDSLTSIGVGAFDGCTNLALTRLPDGLLSIGDRAFYGCTGISRQCREEAARRIGRPVACECCIL